jgi:predicted phosphodiesterase
MYQLEGLNINPGSVGLPRKNKEHTCLYYENKTFYLIDLDTFNVIGTKIIQ